MPSARQDRGESSVRPKSYRNPRPWHCEPQTRRHKQTAFLNPKSKSHPSNHTVRGHCSVTSTETIRTVRDGEPRTATSTFTQLLSSESGQVQCCFTSTETIWTIRDGEPRTTTSTFTQLPSSCAFHFSVALRPQRL